MQQRFYTIPPRRTLQPLLRASNETIADRENAGAKPASATTPYEAAIDGHKP